MAKKIIIKIT